MSKISSIVLYILAAISIILAGLYFLGPKENMLGVDDVPVRFDVNLLWSAVLFVLAAIITLFFMIEYLITHPKSLKGFAISLISGAILVLIAWLLASDAYIPGLIEPSDATPGTLIMADVAIFTAYILGGIAILGMIVSEIYRALK